MNEKKDTRLCICCENLMIIKQKEIYNTKGNSCGCNYPKVEPSRKVETKTTTETNITSYICKILNKPIYENVVECSDYRKKIKYDLELDGDENSKDYEKDQIEKE